ncbi:glycosyltransferase family 2 protein [Proteus mirabilis]|uniref:glycosyltransferase family 2 protein n=1 Tax=Proteus mirabilis TaxID=584 RepID=UPI0018C4BF06|nr:glycosyltransferase family A protein [Proteus mirabilis]MBG3058780.1 glycosyltransferase family 2 protein [Proteus mirabilis]MCL8609225.1 glycosyltransferase family 2 protein [Proteus mirabilis]MCT0124406.1 glycosyltransferase family 2 protein [Proteus mirabilis]MCU9587204.1 glycosyltransferase family 2 protein [Proteus mirabilis]MDF7337831.1 glycosyltransferase family 2 protein [Proteus mirabilis]
MLPSVSVIIPTHNRPDLLKKAISSVLEQTYDVNEIIVVDDTDSIQTEKTIKEFNISKIKYFYNSTGKGACSSRNLGAKKASSEFIAFLDDDDLWVKDKLKEQMLLSHNHSAIFTRLCINYEGTNLKYSTRGKVPKNPLKEICLENFIGGTISCMISREIFLSLGGFDERFPAREEYDLWIRIISNNYKIAIVEKPLAIANRTLNKRERISSNISNYELAINLLNEKHKDLIDNILTNKEKLYRKSLQYNFLAAQAVSISLKKVSFKYYLKSFIIKPNPKTLTLAFLSIISPNIVIKLRSLI